MVMIIGKQIAKAKPTMVTMITMTMVSQVATIAIITMIAMEARVSRNSYRKMSLSFNESRKSSI